MESNRSWNGDKLTLSVPEVAKLIGCSRNHAYKMASTGVLPVIRLGRRLVIPRERLMRWLNGQDE